MVTRGQLWLHCLFISKQRGWQDRVWWKMCRKVVVFPTACPVIVVCLSVFSGCPFVAFLINSRHKLLISARKPRELASSSIFCQRNYVSPLYFQLILSKTLSYTLQNIVIPLIYISKSPTSNSTSLFLKYTKEGLLTVWKLFTPSILLWPFRFILKLMLLHCLAVTYGHNITLSEMPLLHWQRMFYCNIKACIRLSNGKYRHKLPVSQNKQFSRWDFCRVENNE